MVCGYAGKLLRVNLSTNMISEEKLDLSLARNLIGGLGIASEIMLNELDPCTEPFSPENRFILVTGALIGSTVPAANKSVVISRSPLTTIWGGSRILSQLWNRIKALWI